MHAPLDWPDLPINEATIEQHYVAPMPPFLSLALVPDRFHQSRRSTLDDEWRTPFAEDSERNTKTILADHSRPLEICRRGGKVPSL
jgi:hypothetical protein